MYLLRHDIKMNYFVVSHKITNTILLITHNRKIAERYVIGLKK